mgnify:CR=1 FL=1|tara:strand:+ start:11697 stop:13226 length:1530 start_codon:yes stop_codon:yes gene_type:complete
MSRKKKNKRKSLFPPKYFIGALISGIKGRKKAKEQEAKAEADRLLQEQKYEEEKANRQKLTMSPEIAKMKEGLGGTEIQRRQEAAERAKAGAMAAATRGGSRTDAFAAMRAGSQQEGLLASEQAAAKRKGLEAGVDERGKLRNIQEDRSKTDLARQAQKEDYAREDVMAAQANYEAANQQMYGAIDAGIGTLATAVSDRKEKKNIKKKGKTKAGVPVSEFNYKDKEDAPRGPGRYRGVIAQDLVGTEHEGAVKKIGKNTLGVNYSKLDVKLGKIGGSKLKDKIRKRKMTGGGVMDSGEIYKTPEQASNAGNKRIKWRPNEKTRRFRYYDADGNIKHFSVHNPKYFNKNERELKAQINQRKIKDIEKRNYSEGGQMEQEVPAGEPEVTPGKFSHETNPIDLVQRNGDGEEEKIGEMTGGEAIVPPKNVKQIRRFIAKKDGKSLVSLMNRLLTKWDREAEENEESREEFEKTKGGMTKAKHGAVHKPRRPSGKQMFKWDRESRFKNGGIFK